jgi:hypothetical protein
VLLIETTSKVQLLRYRTTFCPPNPPTDFLFYKFFSSDKSDTNQDKPLLKALVRGASIAIIADPRYPFEYIPI